MSEAQAWPIEHFETILLTLVFSLYRTDKSALSRVNLLRSTFITILRELGAFDTYTLTNHLKSHFSGPFAPYTLSMREKFTRLLALTYQFDAYFALAHDKPPMLHRQEVGAGLTSTFTLWNAHGIDKFAARLPDEPPKRSGCQVSEMTSRPDSFQSSQLFVEDVQLGLCGLLQTVWVLRQSPSSKTGGYPGNTFQKILLIETLDEWKYELDKISKLADARNITNKATRDLLLAYRGEDDSVAASLERITTLIQDGMVLYYYLKLYYHAGVVETQPEDTLKNNKHSREALGGALQMLKMVESIGATACLNPVIWHALTLGVNVTKSLLNSGQKCECLNEEGRHEANISLQQWTETGGLVWIDGTPVCVCKLDVWIARFEKAIQYQKIMLE
jgi:hypothetical protein